VTTHLVSRQKNLCRPHQAHIKNENTGQQNKK